MLPPIHSRKPLELANRLACCGQNRKFLAQNNSRPESSFLVSEQLRLDAWMV